MPLLGWTAMRPAIAFEVRALGSTHTLLYLLRFLKTVNPPQLSLSDLSLVLSGSMPPTPTLT
ncbi:hypothetical protein K435DRAFT_785499 [Dendrothele bispora CBS 962.96]|uniref:Uncharacterized protein n=1 Tax=Dendrothele bispora (strain CBS 962.96) TaxID=1314807 RepID=A0A4S8KWR3_DENBC|nr:hypothetical protein K435DRAFT_785499 [Dendrothele bispora CBS 962.96]